jgi:hypothetical protein
MNEECVLNMFLIEVLNDLYLVLFLIIFANYIYVCPCLYQAIRV